MGQGVCVEPAYRIFLYASCGECLAADFVDEGWVVCKHPEHKADAQTLHDGWSANTLPETCPLRTRRAMLGIKEER